MYWSHGVYGVDFFWLFIMVVVLGGTISRVIRSNQREKTIRTAIEKGVALDPATLNSLNSRPSSPQDTRSGLMTGAIVTFFVGCGLMAMGYVLNMGGDTNALHGLMAVGALLWCIALGLLVARFAVGRG
jgi:hypothetical protein